MAKFKVGDKVRVLPHQYKVMGMQNHIGKTATVVLDDGTGVDQYRLDIDHGMAPWGDNDIEFIDQPRREFIVLRRDGAKTIAELRHDREVIKSAVATCSEKDTFDFETGAKIAFDRLMNRQNIEEAVKAWNEPAPHPAHRFKVGDRVVGEYGLGEVSALNERYPDLCLVYFEGKAGHSGHVGSGIPSTPSHSGHCFWQNESELSPAPEPPKFYTGKVFAEKSTDKFFQDRDGHVFEFVDGKCVNATPSQQMYGRFRSFDELRKCAMCTKWHEVNSDV